MVVQGIVNEGDNWFFGSKLPHVIPGAGDAGCADLVAYDQGNFHDTLGSQGLAGWFTQAPAGIAAKAQASLHVSLCWLSCLFRQVHCSL